MHAKFEKKQVEGFPYHGHLAWHAFNGRFIEDGNSGVWSPPCGEKSRSLRTQTSVEQEQDFAKFLILIHELGLEILLLEQDFIFEQDFANFGPEILLETEQKMKNRKN